MHKLMTLVAVAAMFMAVGCSKEGKLESIIREAGKIEKASPEKIDKEVKKALEDFRKASSEEQKAMLEMAEAALKMMKTAEKTTK